MNIIIKKTLSNFRQKTRLIISLIDKILIHRNKKRVLFFSENRLYASYFDAAALILNNLNNVDIFSSGKVPKLAKEAITGFSKQIDIKYISLKISRYRHWDLIIFSGPTYTHFYPNKTNKILIPHGIAGGKLVNGIDWRFGKSQLFSHGHSIFTKIFEPSEHCRQLALQKYPELKDVIVSTGLPIYDDLLEKMNKSSEIKSTILIQSTFGKHSIAETYNTELINLAEKLSEDLNVDVRIALHPHCWNGASGANILGPLLLNKQRGRVKLLPGNSSLEQHFTGVKAVISDRTSLSLSAYLLNIPILFLKTPDDTYIHDSSWGKLYSKSDKFFTDDNVSTLISNLLSKPNSCNNYPKRSEIISHVGTSTSRYKEEIFNLINN